MKPDYYSLAKAGLSQEEIEKISGCEDQEMQQGVLWYGNLFKGKYCILYVSETGVRVL